MKTKLFVNLLCLPLSLCLLVGCNSAKSATATTDTGSREKSTEEAPLPPVPPTDYSEKTLYPSEVLDQLKIYGRSAVIDKSVTCDWTASGIEFSADCKGDSIWI